MNTYFLVISTGYVHGVYGEDLQEMAVQDAQKIPLACVFKARLAARPSVGKTITPQVGWEVIPLPDSAPSPETFPRPKGPTPTIYDIKAAQPADSHFFDRSSMKFFGQTLKMFRVSWNEAVGAWETTAGMYDSSHKFRGISTHCWQVGTLKHLGTLERCKLSKAQERVNKK